MSQTARWNRLLKSSLAEYKTDPERDRMLEIARAKNPDCREYDKAHAYYLSLTDSRREELNRDWRTPVITENRAEIIARANREWNEL